MVLIFHSKFVYSIHSIFKRKLYVILILYCYLYAKIIQQASLNNKKKMAILYKQFSSLNLLDVWMKIRANCAIGLSPDSPYGCGLEAHKYAKIFFFHSNRNLNNPIVFRLAKSVSDSPIDFRRIIPRSFLVVTFAPFFFFLFIYSCRRFRTKLNG